MNDQDDLFASRPAKPVSRPPMRRHVGKAWEAHEQEHRNEIEAGRGKFIHWALVHLNSRKPLPKRQGYNKEWPHWPGLKWKH